MPSSTSWPGAPGQAGDLSPLYALGHGDGGGNFHIVDGENRVKLGMKQRNNLIMGINT